MQYLSSDVSEFEHIYGQILTTPFCVYGKTVYVNKNGGF